MSKQNSKPEATATVETMVDHPVQDTTLVREPDQQLIDQVNQRRGALRRCLETDWLTQEKQSEQKKRREELIKTVIDRINGHAVDDWIDGASFRYRSSQIDEVRIDGYRLAANYQDRIPNELVEDEMDRPKVAAKLILAAYLKSMDDLLTDYVGHRPADPKRLQSYVRGLARETTGTSFTLYWAKPRATTTNTKRLAAKIAARLGIDVE